MATYIVGGILLVVVALIVYHQAAGDGTAGGTI